MLGLVSTTELYPSQRTLFKNQLQARRAETLENSR
jgi:hypothetical protein